MSSSTLLDELIRALQVQPGVGPASASRIAYYLLDRKRKGGLSLAKALTEAMDKISYCPRCRNYTDNEGVECNLCSSSQRLAQRVICVVEHPNDIEAIENSASFKGSYFVLHGHISPLDGIGPESIGLDLLKKRIETEKIEEIILALGQTVEGDVTASYIAAMAKKMSVKVTRIATGVPLGGSLNTVDGNTLALSFNYRHDV